MNKKQKTFIIFLIIILVIGLIYSGNLIKLPLSISGNDIVPASSIIISGSSGKSINQAFTIGLEGECTDASLTYYCEKDGVALCFKDSGQCESWKSGGSHCKSSDPNWCCYDPNHVVCGNIDVCGTQAYCDNLLASGDKSCLGGNCCNTAGYIIDYAKVSTGTACCPSDYPFLISNGDSMPGGGNFNCGSGRSLCCLSTPSFASDNYYTRKSNCKDLGEERCTSDYSLEKCKKVQPFIFSWQSQGHTIGKCNVECTAIGKEQCRGNDLWVCDVNYKYIQRTAGTDRCINVTQIKEELARKVAEIYSLQTSLDEKAKLISSLNISLKEQAEIINNLGLKIEENVVIIQNLNLNIAEQAKLINELTSNLAIKAEYVKQLTAENEKQAQLIKEMEESFSNQGEIIKNLNLTVSDDARIISSLNLTLEQQSQLVSELKLNLREKEELISKLQKNLVEQEVMLKRIQELESLTKLQKTLIYIGVALLIIGIIVTYILIKRRKRR